MLPSFVNTKNVKTLTYSQLLRDARAQKVMSATINNGTGVVTGQLADGTNYSVSGPVPALATEVDVLRSNNVNVNFANSSGFLSLILPYLFPIVLFGKR